MKLLNIVKISKDFLKKYLRNALIISTLVVVSSSLFANFFSYLFQLLIGRALNIADYGVVIAMFSVYSIIGVPFGIIANAITKIVSEVKDTNYPKDVSYFFYSIFRINFVLSVCIGIGIYFLRDYLADYLNISDTSIFFSFSLFLFFSLVFTFNKSFLQALKRFKALSLETFALAFSKFLVAVIVLYLGLGINEIFYLLSISLLIGGLVGFALLSKNIHRSFRQFKKRYLKKIATFSLFSSFTFFGVNLIFNNDLLLVKHLFSSEMAGFYSSAAVIGRIIFYGVSPIAMVLFPICAERFFKKEDYLTPLIKGIVVVFILSFMGFLILYFFPSFVVRILFGDKYITAIGFLPLYALYMVPYSMVSILGWLLVAISKLKEGSVALVFAGIQYFSIKLFFNQNIYQVLYVSIIISFILSFLYLYFVLKEYFRSKNLVSVNK